MNHRLVTIQPLTAAIAAAGVLSIDLDMADPISQLIVEVDVLNGVAASSTDHPLKIITKIEIVDGSDVLYSLNGIQAQALDIYDTGVFPRNDNLWYRNNADGWQDFAINFGRYLWDEELALDPKKFSNPQLRITHNYALGGLAPASVRFRIYALLFDEKAISPSGFLMAKEIKSWTCTDLSHEYTDCPLDHPYRKMLIGSRYHGEAPNTICSYIKLASDQDKKVILDTTFSGILRTIGYKNAKIMETIQVASNSAARYAHCCATMDGRGTLISDDGAATAADCDVSNLAGGYCTFYSAAAGNSSLLLSGYAPHGFCCIPFGKQDEIADWFNVGGLGNLKLDVISGSTTPTQSLVIQQNRSY